MVKRCALAMTAGETAISGPGTPWPQPVELLRDLVDDLHTPNVAQGLAHRGVAGEDGGFKGLREGDIATVIESRIVLDRKLERRLNQAVELVEPDGQLTEVRPMLRWPSRGSSPASVRASSGSARTRPRGVPARGLRFRRI